MLDNRSFLLHKSYFLIIILLLGPASRAQYVKSTGEAFNKPSVTREEWRSLIYQCKSKDSWPERRMCMDETTSLLPNVTGSQEVVDYFFKAKPYPGIRIRHPSCRKRSSRGGSNYGGDIIWKPIIPINVTNNNSKSCFWGNMPFGKSIEIILLAQNLGATHIIESGRMGGISLLHYAHFGFKLTSVELLPVDHVEESLRATHPEIQLLDGDGMTLVPKALSDIHEKDPSARVAIIIDGPKGQMAIKLARKVLKNAVLVILDDQGVKYDIGGPSCLSNSRRWRSIFPMRQDRAALLKPPNPPGVYRWDSNFYCKESDVATFILGGAA